MQTSKLDSDASGMRVPKNDLTSSLLYKDDDSIDNKDFSVGEFTMLSPRSKRNNMDSMDQGDTILENNVEGSQQPSQIGDIKKALD